MYLRNAITATALAMGLGITTTLLYPVARQQPGLTERVTWCVQRRRGWLCEWSGLSGGAGPGL